MTLPNLDIDTLCTLVVANELGGYGEPAARLGRTPSAISLQMKRLQRDVGALLLRKRGRGVGLTEAGEIVLDYAKRILALNDELLPHRARRVVAWKRSARLLAGLRRRDPPNCARTLRGALSARDRGAPHRRKRSARRRDREEQLDLALAIGHDEKKTAEIVGSLDPAWIAGTEFVLRAEQPQPLVALGPQCAFRKVTIGAPDDAGMSWRAAAVSRSVSGVWAAVRRGLGVTVRSALGLPASLSHGKSMFGLPALGEFPATLHTCRRGASSGGVRRLREIVRTAVRELLWARGCAGQ
jgi:DNA-binding transcriptional LysR family regulator